MYQQIVDELLQIFKDDDYLDGFLMCWPRASNEVKIEITDAVSKGSTLHNNWHTPEIQLNEPKNN